MLADDQTGGMDLVMADCKVLPFSLAYKLEVRYLKGLTEYRYKG